MLLNGSENEKLFAKLVPVCLKDVYTNQSRTSHLFLTMEWQDTSAGMYSRKVLSISLTDNDDPFFMYNLQLSEEDFQLLKTNQDLLINFASFPQHIIDYVEMCLSEDKNPHPKFLLVFSVNEKLGNTSASSQFDIIETNQFKHLTHLSLIFIAATETAVKQYIVSSFRHLKDEKRQLKNHLASTEQDLKDKLSNCQHTLSSKVQECDLIRKEMQDELNKRDHNYTLKLQEERNRLITRHKEEEERLERKIKENKEHYERHIQQLDIKVQNLDSTNKELQEKISKDESTIEEMRSKVVSLQSELRKSKDNAQSYKHKYDNLHSEMKDKQSQIRQLDEKISDLEQELHKKDQSNRKLKEKLEKEIDLKKSLEADLEHVKFQYEMCERTRQTLEKDKEKLNDIIVDLQEKLKEATIEEKNKSQSASKYKKLCEDKDRALSDLQTENIQLKICVENKDAKIRQLTESNHSLNIQLTDKLQVVKWLNQKLVANSIDPEFSPTLLDESPSNVAKKQLAKIGTNITPVTTKNTAPKSVRETPSPVYRKSSSTPRLRKAETVDSAYCISPLDHANEVAPQNMDGNHKTHIDEPKFEIDNEALSAAFGNGNHPLKHSTAKKSTKPIKSTIPKVSRKR